MTAAYCRVCLVGDASMISIDTSKQLQDTYERLSNTKIRTGDDAPDMLCYICYCHLQRSHRFMVLSQKSNKILSELFQKGIEQRISSGLSRTDSARHQEARQNRRRNSGRPRAGDNANHH